MIKKDSLITGIVLGIVIPIIAFWAYYLYNFRIYSPGYFIKFVFRTGMIAPILTICLMLNLWLFLIFIKKLEADKSAKGMMISTMLYALFILYFKLR